jgi:hypothetical protein
MCLLRHTFTGSWGSKFMPNTEEFVGNLWKVTLATLELFLQFKTAQYFILWSRSLSCHCCCILDQLLPLYSENSRKIFLRSCNCECTQPERPCTLKNPSRRGWQISWGRLLLNNLLDCTKQQKYQPVWEQVGREKLYLLAGSMWWVGGKASGRGTPTNWYK